jgi:hypothetical protein
MHNMNNKIASFLLFLVLNAINLQAQSDNVVNVIASGDGKTKDLATNAALRNCIEKTFGVFISASSEVKNDRLINDQVSSVASGNIISYEVISEIHNSENFNITVSAKISPEVIVKKLNSKGNVFELKGNVYAQNAIKENFYQSQELIILKDFFDKYKQVNFFNFDFVIGKPKYFELEGNSINSLMRMDEEIVPQYHGIISKIKEGLFSKTNLNEKDYLLMSKKMASKNGICSDCLIFAKLGNEGTPVFRYMNAANNTNGFGYFNTSDNTTENANQYGNYYSSDAISAFDPVFNVKSKLHKLEIIAYPKANENYFQFVNSFISLMNSISLKNAKSYSESNGKVTNIEVSNLSGFVDSKIGKEDKMSFILRNPQSKDSIIKYFYEIYFKSTALALSSNVLEISKFTFVELHSIGQYGKFRSFPLLSGMDVTKNYEVIYRIYPFYHEELIDQYAAQGAVVGKYKQVSQKEISTFLPSRIILLFDIDGLNKLDKIEFRQN